MARTLEGAVRRGQVCTCNLGCGFSGSFDDVATHEEACRHAVVKPHAGTAGCQLSPSSAEVAGEDEAEVALADSEREVLERYSDPTSLAWSVHRGHLRLLTGSDTEAPDLSTLGAKDLLLPCICGRKGLLHFFRASRKVMAQRCDLHVTHFPMGCLGGAMLRRVLSQAQGLKGLFLSNCGIGPAGAISLVEGLTVCTALRDLNLSNNPIGSPGAFALSCWLLRMPGRPTLETLHLQRCSIQTLIEDTFDEPRNRPLGDCVPRSPGGASVTLLQLLCDALAACPGLKTVDLSFNMFSHGTQNLSRLLAIPALTLIRLVSCNLENEDRRSLGWALAMRCLMLPPPAPLQLVGVRIAKVGLHLGLEDERAEVGGPDLGWSNACLHRFFEQEPVRGVAFCMLTHPRLGMDSLWAGLDSDLVQKVLMLPTQLCVEVPEDERYAEEDEDDVEFPGPGFETTLSSDEEGDPRTL